MFKPFNISSVGKMYSLMNVSIAALVILLGLLLRYKNRKKIPGMEPTHSEDGNVPDIRNIGSMASFLIELHKTYGPIASFWEKKKLSVSIASPDFIDHQRYLFDHPVKMNEKMRILVGDESLGLINGQEAKRRRKIYDEHFMVKACGSHNQYFHEIAYETMLTWQNLKCEGNILLKSMCSNTALKAILRTSFGNYFDNEKTFENFKNVLNSVLALIERRPKAGTLEENIFFKNIQTIKHTVAKIITTRRESSKSKHDKDLFIDVLIKGDFTDEQRISDALGFLISGFETVGYTLTWILYEICKHEKLQDKIYEELINILGEDDIVPDKMAQLRVLRQVIDETIRLHFRTLFTGRVTDTEIKIGDYTIPQNTNIYYAVGYMFHDPSIWPDPEKFDHERFDTNKISESCVHAFIPFGYYGKRQCPGWKYAYSEIIIFLSTWCRHYKFLLASDNIDKFSSMNSYDNVWITVHPRSSPTCETTSSV